MNCKYPELSLPFCDLSHLLAFTAEEWPQRWGGLLAATQEACQPRANLRQPPQEGEALHAARPAPASGRPHPAVGGAACGEQDREVGDGPPGAATHETEQAGGTGHRQ